MNPANMQFALQQELRAKQEVVKGRHGKEVVLESVAPAAPPPPIPAVTVDPRAAQDQGPPPERKLLFSTEDLESAKSHLADPKTRPRSPSPAAQKGMKKDMVGDLKDVLAAKKKGRLQGSGGGASSKQSPSVAKLDKSLPK